MGEQFGFPGKLCGFGDVFTLVLCSCSTVDSFTISVRLSVMSIGTLLSLGSIDSGSFFPTKHGGVHSYSLLKNSCVYANGSRT